MSRPEVREDHRAGGDRFFVPVGLRPWLSPLLAGLTLTFVVMAALVWHGKSELSLDRAVQRAIGVPDWTQRSHQYWGDLATELASAPILALLSVGLAASVWRRRGHDWWALALCGIAAPVGFVVELVLKPLVGRRYFGTDYRFPSGHTAAITALVVVAIVVLVPRRASSLTTLVAFGVGLAAIGVVCWGVLVTRAHSPIDAAGGILLGGGLAGAAAAAIDGVRRREPGQSPTESYASVNTTPQ